MAEILLDCTEISCSRQLHEALAKALSFPKWYGHNLDALFDCLTDLPDPTHLVLTGWAPEASYSCGFETVFADAAMENPAFTYVIA